MLVGGFFLCMLIREMDFAFDALWHGAWVWFALAVALVCLWYAARHIAATLRGLADFVTHPGYGMMCAGLLCILVFSRLFGMSVLWQTLMLDGYNRVVKNMVEEGCELLGYGLCLLATLSYMKTVLRRMTRKREGGALFIRNNILTLTLEIRLIVKVDSKFQRLPSGGLLI